MAGVTSRGILSSSVSPQYLHLNSTSHTWPFSAIAELIDNAYDPDVSAKQFWIDQTVFKEQDCLIFMDNGQGMDYDKMQKMLSFGVSDKQTIKDPVGNGFKSGSMRLGKDAIVFSKKASTMCVGLLSQTYLEKIGAQNVIVPIVMFTQTRQTVNAAPEHAKNLHDILTHSLFNTKEELISKFSVIDKFSNSSSGTCIIIWNLQRTLLGELEFDFKKDPNDIQIPVDVYKSSWEKFRWQAWDGMSVPESEYSLRAYCSILYLKPKMQIILKGQKVETQYVTKTLAKVIMDTYQHVCLPPIILKPLCQKKAITITFGYNTKSKVHYGLMMYHENRLIKAYERVACQRRDSNRREGIIGVIVCNHLTPIHNKQDFEDNEEYRRTMSSVEKKLEEYWKHVHFIHDTKCTGRFEDSVKQPDQQWVQCDDCLKWRKLPDPETLPIRWLCHMNTDPKYRSCTDEEEPEDSNDGQHGKPPYQNWVQCDDCQKWRKLPDGIDTTKLPEKWQCSLNPDPQFRDCLVDEEPYNSDDEEPRYQKTYKQYERNQRLQMEKTIQKNEQDQKGTEKVLIFALAKENAELMKKQDTRNLVCQLELGSPDRGRPAYPNNSHLNRHAGSRTPDGPVITHVSSVSRISTLKRCLGPIQENGEIKRARTRDIFESNTPGSPLTSIASPEVCTFIKSATEILNITKVKSEYVESKEELGKQMERANNDSPVSMETSAAALPSNSSIGTQTHQNPIVKQEVGYSETVQYGESNIINFEPPTVESSTSKELNSINAKTRPHQKNGPILEEENQEKSKTTSTLKSEEEPWGHGDISDEISPGYQSSAKLENSVLDVLEAQQQQDTLLELLEVAAKDRDESRSQQLLLSSQVEELRSQLQELKQSTLKKEHSHHSTQTNPEEAEDYKVLYLQANEEIKQLQDELSKLNVEKAVWERKGQEVSLECDELACHIDSLLRELDQRNKEQEELKEKMHTLENGNGTLLTCCESLQKELDELKSETEKAKVSVEDREVETDFPSSLEENTATPTEALNSGGGRDSQLQQHETQGRSAYGRDNNNLQTDSSRLRDLRQRVAQLLLTFIPALDLQQMNYDCNVIDEILTHVINEIIHSRAASM